MIFCGIFDGHGSWGHIVAKRVKKSVPASLLCNWQKALSLTSLPHQLDTEFNSTFHHFDIWKQSYLKTYADVDLELKHHPDIDAFRSGTTALTIIKQVHFHYLDSSFFLNYLCHTLVFKRGYLEVRLR